MFGAAIGGSTVIAALITAIVIAGIAALIVLVLFRVISDDVLDVIITVVVGKAIFIAIAEVRRLQLAMCRVRVCLERELVVEEDHVARFDDAPAVPQEDHPAILACDTPR